MLAADSQLMRVLSQGSKKGCRESRVVSNIVPFCSISFDETIHPKPALFIKAAILV